MKRCTKCSKFYNENLNESCPYCSSENIDDIDDIFDDDFKDSDNISRGLNSQHHKTEIPQNDIPTKTKDFQTLNGNSNSHENSNKTVVITNLDNRSDKRDLGIDPVVGWFVITEGEGIGLDLKIVAGMNTIGRGRNNKIVLDYGDTTISKDHAIVIYDYRNNLFFFQHGGGINLSYINDSVVLQPVELKSGDVIKLGNTTLIFTSFCSEKFAWNRDKTDT
jgi:hypothetical protein